MNFRALITALFRRKTLEADMAEEMRLHLELQTERNLAAGMSREEAEFAARRQFGGVDQIKEIAREQRYGAGMEQLLREFRLAARSLARSPGFTVTTILILVLGIGGVTAMFSTVYAVMIRPLPYADAERLVLGVATYDGVINPMVSGPDYLDFREQSRSFSALGAFMALPYEVSVTKGQNTERASAVRITSGLLDALGVRLSAGRVFAEGEGNSTNPPVAIISHAYWKQHYNAVPDLNGLTVTVDGITRAVVGVLPANFHFTLDGDIWLPRAGSDLGPRRYNNWLLVGRLKPGVSLAQAQSDIDVISARLEQAYPESNSHKSLLLRPLQGAFTDQYRVAFLMLCGGAASVLLIACANAAGLLLARGAAREGELAVRAALGASQGQIMRLLLVKALLLSGIAAVLGALLAVWVQAALMRLLSIEALFVREIGLSWPVLIFVIGVAAVTGLGFGLMPAWRARRPDLLHALKAIGKGGSRRGSRLRGGLVAAQVGTSFVLLVIAGLLSRSLMSLHRTDLGFDARNIMTVEVPLPSRNYNGQARTRFFESLLDNIRAMPGVRAAGAISQLPLRNPSNDISVYDASKPPTNPSEGGNGYQRVVLPGYFEAMGIPLLAGRDVRSSDIPGSNRVVVISQTLGRQLFGDLNPLGRKIVVDGVADQPWEVVGVVGDVKVSNLSEEQTSRGALYRPHAQFSESTMRLAIRTDAAPETLVAPLRVLLQKMDPNVPLSGPRTMAQLMDAVTISHKTQTLFLTTFSALAVLLASVGIHGLLAYQVKQQQREIGIRIALGADPRGVALSVLSQAGRLVLLGSAGGVLIALAVSRVIRGSLYGVGPNDPIVFVSSMLAMALLAAIAAWVPARRATRINPTEALRAE